MGEKKKLRTEKWFNDIVDQLIRFQIEANQIVQEIVQEEYEKSQRTLKFRIRLCFYWLLKIFSGGGTV